MPRLTSSTYLARAAALTLALLPVIHDRAVAASEPNFESPPVHPVELAPDGSELYVAHTADHRLVVFDLSSFPPARVREIMVGMEPVSVRATETGEVWVVNYVSNSVSIVDPVLGQVVKTLHPGAEPTDVAFAAGRAFVSVSEADLVRVYDLSDLDASPLTVPLEASDPRSLAVSNDGGTVFVCALDSGNRTTVVPFVVVDAAGGPPAPDPPMNPSLPSPPRVSLIVRHDGGSWLDEKGGVWDSVVPYSMPDNDVIAINSSTLGIDAVYHDVGTSLFNLSIDPVTGDLWVSNQEAINEVRFEPILQGQFVQNRLTHIDPVSGTVTPHHLNAHIDYSDPAGNDAERGQSLCIPLDVVTDSLGTSYLAAFGSGKIGVVDAAGTVVRRIDVGQGPAGLALDPARNRLYAYNRFASSLSIVDLSDDSSVEVSLGFDPSPPAVKLGRRFLYDGEISSAHGDLACASCHIFGRQDNVAWDLGNPWATDMIPVPPGQLLNLPDFHPMKGPMTTQTLLGLADTEPLHWRGDREVFADFNPAFQSLMGRSGPLDPGDFQDFEDFIMTLRYPANPFRSLDGSLPSSLGGADPQNGENLFLTGNLVGGAQCVSCHALPTGENGVIIPGAALNEDEAKVVPQLRNMHEKTRFDAASSSTVRGFGFTHDGAVPTLFEFLQFPAFTFDSDSDRRDVAAFLMAFDTGTPPALGAQWTTDGGDADVPAHLDTLEGLADLNVVGLVAKGSFGGQPRGWVYVGSGAYRPDKEVEEDESRASLLALAGPGTEVTFTAVFEGCEWRLGIDRDEDGFRDGDELDAGSDPGDPLSQPDTTSTGVTDLAGGMRSRLWIASANPAQGPSLLRYRVGLPGRIRLEVFDVRGRRVRSIETKPFETAGVHERRWDLTNDAGRSVSSGIYFLRLETEDAVLLERITIIR